jgi:hypothetical protein
VQRTYRGGQGIEVRPQQSTEQRLRSVLA